MHDETLLIDRHALRVRQVDYMRARLDDITDPDERDRVLAAIAALDRRSISDDGRRGAGRATARGRDR